VARRLLGSPEEGARQRAGSIVRAVRGTASDVHHMMKASALPRGDQAEALGDAGYQGAGKWNDATRGMLWNIAMHPGQGRASAQGDQVPVWARQGALLRAGQKHGVTDHAARTVQPVGKAAATQGFAGMSAPAKRERAYEGGQTAARY
jgi:hypothetical protein